MNTIRELILDYLHEQRELLRDGDPNALAAGTLENYRLSLEGPIMAEFGLMPPRKFKSSHAAQYLRAARLGKRAVAGNRDIAALASAFNHGMGLGIVDSNPCRGVRRNKERPRTRKVSIAEVNDLMAVAEGLGGGYLMVAIIALMVAVTGRRRQDILSLDKEALTADGVLVSDRKTKRHGERHYRIKWSPLLRTIIERAGTLREGVDSPYVFPSRFGIPYTDSGFKSNWNRIIRAYEAKHGERFRAHDLRALYVSEMLDREQSPNTHQNEATMRRVYDRRKVIEVTPLA